MRRAVFLDRDNTLVFDPGYLNDATQVIVLPGVAAALAELQQAGFLLVVASNQAGVARGLVTVEQVHAIEHRLCQLLPGISFAAFEYCFHHPDEACACRKPAPTMLRRAAARLAIDLGRSVMVGDKESDVEAGRAAGCSTVRIVSRPDEAAESHADLVVPDLAAAVPWICARLGEAP